MLSEVVEAYKLARLIGTFRQYAIDYLTILFRDTLLSHEKASTSNAQMIYPGSVLGKRKRSDMSITSGADSPGTSKMSRLDSNHSSANTTPMRSPNEIQNAVLTPRPSTSQYFWGHTIS